MIKRVSVLLAVAAVVRCTIDHVAGGGGSDVGNGVVAGSVVTSEGKPAACARVLIIPSEYNPVILNPKLKIVGDTADVNGVYRIIGLQQGTYSLEARAADDGTRLLVEKIRVEKDSENSPRKDTLQRPGSIRLALPYNVDTVNGYVYVPGTTIAKLLRAAKGDLMIDSVPATVISALHYGVTDSGGVKVIRYDIRVVSDAVTVISHPAWKHMRRLSFNTTASGAAVDGNVENFPVLVRLTRSNFDFSEARAGGEDLRFIKPDNTMYPYELEQWDAAGENAVVWVKIDTVFGGDSSHYVNMYWGNDSVSGKSDGPAVFDTSAQFTGVWHLDEEVEGRGNRSVYRDATVNGYHGRDDIAETGRDGIIGFGKNFGNSDTDSLNPQCDEVILPASSCFVRSSTAPFTLSMWVKVGGLKNDLNRLFTVHRGDTLGSTFAFGIYKGDSVSLTLWQWTTPSRYPVFNSITAGAWHHGAVCYHEGLWSLYIDGYLVDSDTASYYEAGGSTSAVIGGFGDCRVSEPGFDGAMDEVRFEHIARSADWLRLCYMNQRMDDRLVVFK